MLLRRGLVSASIEPPKSLFEVKCRVLRVTVLGSTLEGMKLLKVAAVLLLDSESFPSFLVFEVSDFDSVAFFAFMRYLSVRTLDVNSCVLLPSFVLKC